MIRFLYRYLRVHLLHYLIPPSRKPIFAGGKRGVEVIGLLHTASGIGESARLCAVQLKKSGFKVKCTSVEKAFMKPHEIEWDFEDTATQGEIGCRIFHLNPPMLPPVIIKLGIWKYAGIFNIAYWAWELEQIPCEWSKALRYVNAVFCPSEFTTRAIAQYTKKSVMTVPHPVSIGAIEAGMRSKLRLHEKAFIVANIFSFGSALERKNPYAVLKAFIHSLTDKDNAWLIFKSTSGGASEEKKQFLKAIKPYKNIILIDDFWTREEISGFIQSSNIYISLHRSEGFGLPIAEAMLLGIPTMVTDWSGNRDFCFEDNSFLVGHTIVPVNSDHPEYKALGSLKWADPNSDEAAAKLLEVYENYSIATAKADKCLQVTNSYFSEPIYAQSLNALAE